MSKSPKKILITGGLGQIGSELYQRLKKDYPEAKIVVTDIRKEIPSSIDSADYRILDVTNESAIEELCKTEKFDLVFHMVAVLSATAEKKPILSWELNTEPLLILLRLAKEGFVKTLFYPSSIAVFGVDVGEVAKQNSATIPFTSYGIAKVAGELWCNYFNKKYGVDVRSLRYPGIISYRTPPGGGTTDYAVDIFHSAVKEEVYNCFLSHDRALPMMYIDDAIEATLMLASAPSENIKCRTSYNISAFSFTPYQLFSKIKKFIPDFKVDFKPDHRDELAATWPSSIEDNAAQNDWNWKAKIDLDQMVEEMLAGLNP